MYRKFLWAPAAATVYGYVLPALCRPMPSRSAAGGSDEDIVHNTTSVSSEEGGATGTPAPVSLEEEEVIELEKTKQMIKRFIELP